MTESHSHLNMNRKPLNETYICVGGGIEEKHSVLTVVYRATLFHIHVHRDNVKGTAFEEYVRRVKTYEAPEGSPLVNWNNLCDCILSPCLPLLEDLAPPREGDLTIYDYFQAPTYSLNIATVDGQVRANLISGPTYTPAFDISTMSTNRLFLSCHVPHFQACNLTIMSEHESPRAVPSKVRTPDGTVRFFKPHLAGMDAEFAREIGALSRIIDLGLNKKIRVANLVGIVVADEGSAILGMLLEWVSGSTLGNTVCIKAREHHAKWKKQVMEIIETLHASNIVWGDVNTHNIIVDGAANAWIVDFGGCFNPQFIDEENAETKTGDWQGFHKLFDEWLVQQTTEIEAT